MNTIKLELTEQEALALIECLDVATKAGGLQVARATLPLTNNLMEAVQASKKEDEPTE